MKYDIEETLKDVKQEREEYIQAARNARELAGRAQLARRPGGAGRRQER